MPFAFERMGWAAAIAVVDVHLYRRADDLIQTRVLRTNWEY